MKILVFYRVESVAVSVFMKQEILFKYYANISLFKSEIRNCLTEKLSNIVDLELSIEAILATTANFKHFSVKQSEVHLKLAKHLRWSFSLKTVNCFRKKLYHRCLTGIIRLWNCSGTFIYVSVGFTMRQFKMPSCFDLKIQSSKPFQGKLSLIYSWQSRGIGNLHKHLRW